MTALTSKRADQLVVGDRIQPGYLPAYARSGEGRVMLVDLYEYRGAPWVFVAFACADGDRNCTYYLPSGNLQVFPAETGLAYSRADEDPQPVACRVPPHMGAVTEVGLVEVPEDDGCPKDADGRVVHDLECAEDREMAELDAWTSQPHAGDDR